MDDTELHELLLNSESDRVERKPSISQKQDIRHTICAFANDLPNNKTPGVIFIGVHDDGSCANLDISDDLLKSLSDIVSDAITPPPTCKVSKEHLSSCDLAVIVVEPSVSTPVRCKGGIYVRVGPTTRVANQEQEIRLREKRKSRDLPYDLRPINSASISDLNDIFTEQYIRWVVNQDILEENNRSRMDQLKSLKLVDSSGEDPTVLGLLLCSTDCTKYIPGAYIQFLRINGSDDSDIQTSIIDEAAIYGTVVQQIVRIEEKFTAHNKTQYSYEATPSVIRPEYPKKAFEQVIRNAILHRTYESSNAPVRVNWYNDRIEIRSPGGPFGSVTREKFGMPGVTDYRNPNLAEALKNLGYVQKFGSGIGIIRTAMSENGNPEPEFQADDTNILVTLKIGDLDRI